MKKKVLFIIESMGGGARKHLMQIVSNLDISRFELFLIYGTKNMDQASLEAIEVNKDRCKFIKCHSFQRSLSVEYDYKTYKFISTKIKEIGPDIIHCHSSKAGVLGRLAAKRNGVSDVYYTPHAYSFLAPEFNRKQKALFLTIELILARFTTKKTFCVSNGEKSEALKRKIDRSSKIKVIYNGLPKIDIPDSKIIRDKFGFDGSNIIIGNNARLSEQKNPFLFLNIAKKMINENSQYHFVWCGTGPLYQAVEEWITKNKLVKNIHLLGDRKDSDIIVNMYDVFLTTSLYEGFPYSPIEALRADVPVVASDVIGNSEIVRKNGYNGYTFTSNNLLEAIESIKYVLGNPLTHVKDSFEENFLEEKMIKTITNYYLS